MKQKDVFMKSNVKILNNGGTSLIANSLGVVSLVDQGEAKEVYVIDQDVTLNVSAHATNVPFLQNGDEVVVLVDKSDAIITHRLRGSGERPQQGFDVNTDGSLTVKNANGIVIQTDKSKIELRDDGYLYIDGKEIYTISDGVYRIQGTTIELN